MFHQAAGKCTVNTSGNVPLVSVYITTCNRAEMLGRAIDSVLQQDYRPIEIIVVDDASQDHTNEVLKCYAEQLATESQVAFVTIIQPENKGACAARNAAIKVANGHFITGLDDDDEFLVGRISVFVSAWQEKYSALLSCHEVDRGNGVIEYLDKYVGRITLDQLLEKNRAGSQIFTLTERFRKIGGFDESFPAWQDYEAWIRLALEYGGMLKLPETTYRVHTGHDRPRITSHDNSLKAIQLLRKKHGHRLSAHHRRTLVYRELTAARADYKKLAPWLPAMTFRTFPTILKRWFLSQFNLYSPKP